MPWGSLVAHHGTDSTSSGGNRKAEEELQTSVPSRTECLRDLAGSRADDGERIGERIGDVLGST